MSVPHPFVREVGRSSSRLGVESGRVIVAVSGGPDSVALLLALATLRHAGDLVIAHVNHQLRGAESDADEEFVRDLHERLAAERIVSSVIQLQRVDTAELARDQKDNLEAVARHIRYDWLSRVANESGAHWLGPARSGK